MCHDEIDTEKELDPMELWNLFETTDTKFTKRRTDGAKLTSINAEYQIKRFTEHFGPCGRLWGFTIKRSKFVKGACMISAELKDAEGQPLNFGPSKIHTLELELWYMAGGEKNCITGIGHTPFITMTRYGPTTDADYEKKSVTDALTKAMSMLGMGGDVRMGQFDDAEYVAGLQREEAMNGAVDKEAEIIKQRQQYDEWYIATLELVRTAVSIHELEVVYKSGRIRISGQGTPDQLVEFDAAKTTRAKALLKKEREAA